MWIFSVHSRMIFMWKKKQTISSYEKKKNYMKNQHENNVEYNVENNVYKSMQTHLI